MKSSLLLLLIFLISGLLSATPTIRFRVLTPAVIDVPDYITSIALIDRSVPADAKKNKVESFLTELPGSDKIASQYALDGLFKNLQNSGLYKVMLTSKVMVKNSMPETYPDLLTWEEVEKLCFEFKTDAIITLEVFDTDYLIPTSTARIETGFRLYDPKQKTIIDQYRSSHEVAYNTQVTSLAGALNRAIDQQNVIRDASFESGIRYGERISPSWYYVVRDYYKRGKGSADLKTGARMMEVNDWDAAQEYLKKALNDNKRKTKGRASHNLAVVNEILGNLDEAKKYAQDAWGVYRNKGSKDYSFQLGQRIREQEILIEQNK